MNYQILDDYLFALQRSRDAFDAQGNEESTALYQRYADAIDFSTRHVRYGTKLTPHEVGAFADDLMYLFAPNVISQLVPAGREQATYAAVCKLARCMARVRLGRPAKRFFGLIV